jgi:hypothetical protein
MQVESKAYLDPEAAEESIAAVAAQGSK